MITGLAAVGSSDDAADPEQGGRQVFRTGVRGTAVGNGSADERAPRGLSREGDHSCWFLHPAAVQGPPVVFPGAASRSRRWRGRTVTQVPGAAWVRYWCGSAHTKVRNTGLIRVVSVRRCRGPGRDESVHGVPRSR